ncbi:hypothetical protein DL770_010276 [Monosporascus sp. CRB-9-2]|nr:hypothetical protein DL770_010276 [Monosporascus sp. CRB-9-2]
MRTSLFLLIFGALLPTALADFWIYYWRTPICRSWVCRTEWVYGFLNSADPEKNLEPTCAYAEKTRWEEADLDISNLKGIRCKNCQDGDGPRDIEWNNEMGHFTVYQGRNYGMYDVHDNKVGQCYLKTPYSGLGSYLGCGLMKEWGITPLVFCESEYSAEPINGSNIAAFITETFDRAFGACDIAVLPISAQDAYGVNRLKFDSPRAEVSFNLLLYKLVAFAIRSFVTYYTLAVLHNGNQGHCFANSYVYMSAPHSGSGTGSGGTADAV